MLEVKGVVVLAELIPGFCSGDLPHHLSPLLQMLVVEVAPGNKILEAKATNNLLVSGCFLDHPP
jgi:hypothetical protein